jgi:hypothetical protein
LKNEAKRFTRGCHLAKYIEAEILNCLDDLHSRGWKRGTMGSKVEKSYILKTEQGINHKPIDAWARSGISARHFWSRLKLRSELSAINAEYEQLNLCGCGYGRQKGALMVLFVSRWYSDITKFNHSDEIMKAVVIKEYCDFKVWQMAMGRLRDARRG